MILKFYIDRYGNDVKPHFEFVWVVNGDFYKSYLADFLQVPGSFIDFVAAYESFESDVPFIYFDEEGEGMFYA